VDECVPDVNFHLISKSGVRSYPKPFTLFEPETAPTIEAMFPQGVPYGTNKRTLVQVGRGELLAEYSWERGEEEGTDCTRAGGGGEVAGTGASWQCLPHGTADHGMMQEGGTGWRPVWRVASLGAHLPLPKRSPAPADTPDPLCAHPHPNTPP
jgi:hypothetical protein